MKNNENITAVWRDINESVKTKLVNIDITIYDNVVTAKSKKIFFLFNNFSFEYNLWKDTKIAICKSLFIRI